MNKLPNLTALSYLTALVESVDLRFDKKFKKLKEYQEYYDYLTFIHQVILETVEMVGKEILHDIEDAATWEVNGKGFLITAEEWNKLTKKRRARLSQLMDSLKEENNWCIETARGLT